MSNLDENGRVVLGLYIGIPTYLFLTSLLALRSYNRSKTTKNDDKAEISSSVVADSRAGVVGSDPLSSHYLASRSLHGLIAALTMFATVYGSYFSTTLANQSYLHGWSVLRSIPAATLGTLLTTATGLRLRKLSLVRSHSSPTDFITDRYKSNALRYTVFLLQIVPTIIFLGGQMTAINFALNSMFQLEDSYYPVVVIGGLIVLFEWIGGITAICHTEAFQASIMAFTFILLPSIVTYHFGGWNELDWRSYPRPDFYQTPTTTEQFQFLNAMLTGAGGTFALPHIIQRTYAASSLKDKKMGDIALTLGPWVVLLPGVFLGTVGVSILRNFEDVPNPLGTMLGILMETGGVAHVAAVIAYTSALATMMSTANSLLLGVSHLLTAEVFFPFWHDAKPTSLMVFARLASLTAMGTALSLAIFGSEKLLTLWTMQIELALQSTPSFLVGLYAKGARTDVHPWCLTLGAWAGVSAAVFLNLYDKDTDQFTSIPFHNGVAGVIVNVFAAVSCELLRRKQYGLQDDAKEDIIRMDGESAGEILRSAPLQKTGPTWDTPLVSRFGDVRLTPHLINRCMEGVTEPITQPWFLGLVAVLAILVVPLVAEGEPPLDQEGYLAYPPGLIGGIPTWAFKVVLFSALLTLVLLLTILCMVPNEYPLNFESIERNGIDPNTVQMTRSELLMRDCYDETNDEIRERRNTIRASMIERGIGRRLRESSHARKGSDRSLQSGMGSRGGSYRHRPQASLSNAAPSFTTSKDAMTVAIEREIRKSDAKKMSSETQKKARPWRAAFLRSKKERSVKAVAPAATGAEEDESHEDDRSEEGGAGGMGLFIHAPKRRNSIDQLEDDELAYCL